DRVSTAAALGTWTWGSVPILSANWNGAAATALNGNQSHGAISAGKDNAAFTVAWQDDTSQHVFTTYLSYNTAGGGSGFMLGLPNFNAAGLLLQVPVSPLDLGQGQNPDVATLENMPGVYLPPHIQNFLVVWRDMPGPTVSVRGQRMVLAYQP